MSVAALVAAYNDFGQSLHRRLAPTPGNIVLSPLSIGMAVAMALSGARGETEAEIRRLLGLRLSRDEIEAANRALIRMLESHGDVDAMHLAIANALLLDATLGGLVLPSYRERLQTCFAAEVRAGAKAAQINAWVADKTMGLIPTLVDAVDPDTVAVIVNAVAFAANWAAPFDPDDTAPGTFTLADGTTASVPMMRRRLHAPVCETTIGKAIFLPFVPSHLGLVCVLPDQGVDPTSAEAATLWSAGPPRFVDLTLPKFHLDARFDLVPLLAASLRFAFTDAADFRDIVDAEPGAKIGQVQHAACVTVDEAGCAAAAATAVAAVAAGIRPPDPEPEPFALDRPFLFRLVDTSTGAVLMQGRVVDPRPRGKRKAAMPGSTAA